MPRLRTTAGFTLIELMIVIFIIGLLIAILLPSLAAARANGYALRTKARIQVLGDGCQQYYKNNGDAYPGQDYMSSMTSNAGEISTSAKYTGSQLLARAMLTEKTAPSGTATPKFPTSAYVDYVDTMLITANGRANTISDDFPDAKPLLYFPSIRGNTGHLVDNSGTTPPQVAAFNYYHNAAYTTGTNPAEDATAMQTLLKSPTDAARAKNSDYFVLLGAGVDRIYFTSDDTVNVVK